jgi:hypothetical protein
MRVGGTVTQGAHNPRDEGSNPSPATNQTRTTRKNNNMTEYIGRKVNCDDCTPGETLGCRSCNGHGYVIECDGTDISPTAAAIAVVGVCLFKIFLVVGLVCFVAVAVGLTIAGFFS